MIKYLLLVIILMITFSSSSESRHKPPPPPPPGTAFYVSSAGSDNNPGTYAAPFATLGRAQTAMRGSTVKTTYIRSGTIIQTTTLELTSSDNGELWTGYPNDPAQSAHVVYGLLSGLMIHVYGASNITISNLTIDGGTSGGAGVNFAAVFSEHNSSDIHVKSNKFLNNFNQSDFYIYNSDDMYFQGNTSGPNEYQPVSAHVTDGTTHTSIFVTDNHLFGFSRIGVELQGNSGNFQDVHVDRNLVSDDAKSVIGISDVTGGSTCSTVWGNTINGTSGQYQWAIEIASPNASLEYNTTSNVDTPFSIASVPGSEIENNTMSNFGNDPPYNNYAYNEDGGYDHTEWIGTNTLNGAAVTGWIGHGPYGTRPAVCAPSVP